MEAACCCCGSEGLGRLAGSIGLPAFFYFIGDFSRLLFNYNFLDLDLVKLICTALTSKTFGGDSKTLEKFLESYNKRYRETYLEEGREEGREKGRVEGALLRAYNIALNLLDKFDLDTSLKIAELSEEDFTYLHNLFKGRKAPDLGSLSFKE